MLPRERVIQVINHQKPDRIPVYGWLFLNMEEQIAAKHGSLRAFEDRYEFDLHHSFKGPWPFKHDAIDAFSQTLDDELDPEVWLDAAPGLMNDVNDMHVYEPIKEEIAHYKEKCGRFTLVQTQGIFECLNSVFGIENHMCYLLQYEDELREIYHRQAEWNSQFAMNCLDLGIDCIHISDDWGSQRGLMFSPELWHSMISPYIRQMCEAVQKRGAWLSLHSCGCVMDVIDGVIDLGFHILHPFQESAGMDLNTFKAQYRDQITVMGGLDVQATLGFDKIENVKAEIDRVLPMFTDGGLIYCTSHFVQDHCSAEELTIAYDHIYNRIRELAN